MSKKIFIIGILFLLLTFSVSASDLSNYPDLFIKGNNLDLNIVVGNKAPATHVIAQTQLALALSSETNKPATGIAKLASEITDIENRDLISIGDSCINEVSKKISGQKCGKTTGRIAIEYYESNGDKYIVLNAKSDSDIKQLAGILVNYKDNNLKGDRFVLNEGHVVEEIELTPSIYEEEDEELTQLEEEEIIETKIENTAKKPVPELYDDDIKEDSSPKPALKSEDDPIKKIISWLLSLFGK